MTSDNWQDKSAAALGALIETGALDPRDLTEYFLARIAEHDRDGAIYLAVTAARARREAVEARNRQTRGLRRSPLDGVPISWKDLFDVAGTPTTGGSLLLKNNRPQHDAILVKRLSRAGLVVLGKTNLTELAFSGLGINPVTGTPANPFDRQIARVPGGSSSGAALSLAKGLAAAAIGTDTGGSVRIPAAWNNLVGLKTTPASLPMAGVLPLAQSLDSVGPLTATVEDAALLYALLNGRVGARSAPASLRGRSFLVPENIVWDDAEPQYAARVETALAHLERAGASLTRAPLAALTDLDRLVWSQPSFIAAEAWANWGKAIGANGSMMFDEVRKRFELGRDVSFADIAAYKDRLAAITRHYLAATRHYDAVLMPTVPLAPPPIEPLLASSEAYAAANRLALRNTSLGNQLGLCALTLRAGMTAEGFPVGLMINARPGHERTLLALGSAIESCLATAAGE